MAWISIISCSFVKNFSAAFVSSGKSTIGVLLAKRLGFSFVDVDIVIQEKEGRLLKEIIAQEGMDGFLKVEERVNASLDVTRSVIAPGGSVIYGRKAMEHLKEISEVVYLKMSYEEMEKRGFVNPAPAGQAEIDAVRAGFSDIESNF